MNLRATIQSLAQEFANSVIRELHKMPISELTAVAPSRPAVAVRAASAPARGPRVSDEQTINSLVGAVSGSKTGMRADQIQQVTGLAQKDIARPLAKALERGLLSKRGQRRGTTYFAR